MKKILLIIILTMLSITNVNALSKVKTSEVNIYLFYGETCPHCKEEKKLLDKYQKEYDNINIYKYEIVESKDNIDLLREIEKTLNIEVKSVPFTIIGEKHIQGYSKSKAPKLIKDVIDFYSINGYEDNLLPITKVDSMPEILNKDASLQDYLKDKEKQYVDIPIIGKVDIANFTLPVITIIIALLDGVNPCAMWVLLFLISMLMGMKDKKRMWLLGLSFIITSAVIYFLFMASWLNVTSYLKDIKLFRIIIGLVAITGGVINLRSYIKTRKESGCDIIDEKKRTKVFNKIKKFTTEKSFLLALLGIITLAITVNIIELACSAGLPVMYIEILKLNSLSEVEYYIYLLLYTVIFLIDDLVVFFIAMITMQVSGVSTKFGKISKLVGGILLLLIGIIMLIKPEWLMFNFG